MSLDFDRIKKSESSSKKRKTGFAHKGCANGLSFLDDGRHLLTYGSFDGRLRKWDLDLGLNTKARFPRFAPNLNFKMELNFATTPSDLVFLPVADTVVVLDTGGGDRLAT